MWSTLFMSIISFISFKLWTLWLLLKCLRSTLLLGQHKGTKDLNCTYGNALRMYYLRLLYVLRTYNSIHLYLCAIRTITRWMETLTKSTNCLWPADEEAFFDCAAKLMEAKWCKDTAWFWVDAENGVSLSNLFLK